MPYFLCDEPIQLSKNFFLRGAELKHLRLSRKIRKGEKIEVQDPEKKRFLCLVTEVQNAFIILSPIEALSLEKEWPPWFQIYIPPLKEKALDFIFQKATELNGAEIHLYPCQNSQALPNGQKLQSRLERWSKICLEACKQSGRSSPPKIIPHPSFDHALEQAKNQGGELFCFHPQGSMLGKNLGWEDNFSEKGKGISLFIGPEGGFTEKELCLFPNPPYQLPFPILRAETAALACLTLFQFFLASKMEPKKS